MTNDEIFDFLCPAGESETSGWNAAPKLDGINLPVGHLKFAVRGSPDYIESDLWRVRQMIDSAPIGALLVVESHGNDGFTDSVSVKFGQDKWSEWDQRK